MKDHDILNDEELIQHLRTATKPKTLRPLLRAQTFTQCTSKTQRSGSYLAAALLAASLLASLLVPRFSASDLSDPAITHATSSLTTWSRLESLSPPPKRHRHIPTQSNDSTSEQAATTFRQRADRLAQRLSSTKIQF